MMKKILNLYIQPNLYKIRTRLNILFENIIVLLDNFLDKAKFI